MQPLHKSRFASTPGSYLVHALFKLRWIYFCGRSGRESAVFRSGNSWCRSRRRCRKSFHAFCQQASLKPEGRVDHRLKLKGSTLCAMGWASLVCAALHTHDFHVGLFFFFWYYSLHSWYLICLTSARAASSLIKVIWCEVLHNGLSMWRRSVMIPAERLVEQAVTCGARATTRSRHLFVGESCRHLLFSRFFFVSRRKASIPAR